MGWAKRFNRKPNARGLNSREPWLGKGCRLTIVGRGRDALVVVRRGRWWTSVRPRRSRGRAGRPHPANVVAAVQFDVDPEPDYVGCDPDSLPYDAE